MKLNLASSKIALLNDDTNFGWTEMPKFGAGYQAFISRNLSDDDFEPAAALSDEANDFLASVPMGDTGWGAVSNNVQSRLGHSFWSTITEAAMPAHA